MDYENRSSEIIERVLLALGIFMGAIIVGYNAFFVPGINSSTVIETSADVENSEISNDNSNVNTDENSKVDNDKVETEVDAKKDSNESKNNVSSSKSKISKSNNKSSNKKSSNASSTSKVDINTATASELAENLKGVGEAIAKRIIDYRNKNGGFANIDELKKVKGIGDKIFENIKNNIYV